MKQEEKDILLKIKHIREEKGLSREDVAQILGLTASAYNKIERGAVTLTVERLLELAHLFGVPADSFFQLNSIASLIEEFAHLRARIIRVENEASKNSKNVMGSFPMLQATITRMETQILDKVQEKMDTFSQQIEDLQKNPQK